MIRHSLPNRRASETLEFEHEGHRYRGSVSYDRRGKPLEVFLTTGKPGTGVETVSRDAAVAVSLALQHGTPLETLRKAITRLDDGRPAGPLGVLLDAVARGGDA
jgi:ribonucleoside-diphosphate reductase alpha chain